MYVFGGNDVNRTFSDLWRISLKNIIDCVKKQWEIEKEEKSGIDDSDNRCKSSEGTRTSAAPSPFKYPTWDCLCRNAHLEGKQFLSTNEIFSSIIHLCPCIYSILHVWTFLYFFTFFLCFLPPFFPYILPRFTSSAFFFPSYLFFLCPFLRSILLSSFPPSILRSLFNSLLRFLLPLPSFNGFLHLVLLFSHSFLPLPSSFLAYRISFLTYYLPLPPSFLSRFLSFFLRSFLYLSTFLRALLFLAMILSLLLFFLCLLSSFFCSLLSSLT